MFSRRKFISTLALSALSVKKVVANLRTTTTSASACFWNGELEPKSIAIVGDLQRTSEAERLFLSRSQNDAEREAILNRIAEDRPEMLLLVGDQVSTGDDDDDWGYFDRVIRPVNEAKVPVRAMFGNHDYGTDRNHCVRNFCERFPSQSDEAHGVTRLGRIALVTVDSNFDQLSQSDIYRQAEHYRKALGELEEDRTITGIVVASHHPPYTNSDMGANHDVISMFAEPFLRARKTRLFLSGHVHSYERFSAGDKMFVVTGGGGGPRRSVSTASDRPFQNDAYRTGTIRPFHYVQLEVSDTAISAEVRMLQKSGFKVGDRFSLGLYPQG
jgi:Icc-related predicted phosphoesterase